jgi:uncharacterized protein
MQPALSLSWQEIEEYVDGIKRHALTLPSAVSGVYGVPRGGIIPAVLLAHLLEKPLLAAPSPQCIIIDDIADTGKTLEQFGRYHCSPALITALVHRKSCTFASPLYFTPRIIDTDAWVIFPWER